MKPFPCPWCLYAIPGGYFCTRQCEMTEEERRALAEQIKAAFDRDKHPWAYRGICPACGKGDVYAEYRQPG